MCSVGSHNDRPEGCARPRCGAILADEQAAVSPDAALGFRFAKKKGRREVKQGNIPCW
jgi:hypothetical protein